MWDDVQREARRIESLLEVQAFSCYQIVYSIAIYSQEKLLEYSKINSAINVDGDIENPNHLESAIEADIEELLSKVSITFFYLAPYKL